jgi:hypothetical protein
MPKYKVTGGQDGTAGVDVNDKWYAPGETVEMPATKADWLVEQGYLSEPKPAAKKPAMIKGGE